MISRRRPGRDHPPVGGVLSDGRNRLGRWQVVIRGLLVVVDDDAEEGLGGEATKVRGEESLSSPVGLERANERRIG